MKNPNSTLLDSKIKLSVSPEDNDAQIDMETPSNNSIFGDSIMPGLKLVMDLEQSPKVAFLGKVTKWNTQQENWYAYNGIEFSFID